MLRLSFDLLVVPSWLYRMLFPTANKALQTIDQQVKWHMSSQSVYDRELNGVLFRHRKSFYDIGKREW